MLSRLCVSPLPKPEKARATGTYDFRSVALPTDKPGVRVSISDKMDTQETSLAIPFPSVVSVDLVTKKGPLTSPVNGPVKYARQDLNL